jgi:hypothetical protein
MTPRCSPRAGTGDRLARRWGSSGPALGIVPPGTELQSRNPSVPTGTATGDRAPAGERTVFAWLMGAYAAMLHHADQVVTAEPRPQLAPSQQSQAEESGRRVAPEPLRCEPDSSESSPIGMRSSTPEARTLTAGESQAPAVGLGPLAPGELLGRWPHRSIHHNHLHETRASSTARYPGARYPWRYQPARRHPHPYPPMSRNRASPSRSWPCRYA